MAQRTIRAKLQRTLRRLRADERGAALLEFAFVAPALLALILAIVDTSMQFFAQQSIDTVNEKASRLLITGQATTQNWSQSDFKAQVCARLPSFMDCNKVAVDVRRASTFDTLDTSMPTFTADANGNPLGTTSYTPPGPSDVVLLRRWATAPPTAA